MSEPVTSVQDQVEVEKNKNFIELRKIAEQERSARIALEERLAAMEKSSMKNVPSDEEDDDEPYIDKKKLKKVLSGFQDEMEKKMEVKAEEKARSLVEQERTSQYLKDNSDFNQVMNSDVVQKFADAHPKLAEQILRMPDGFDRQKLVYEAIKSMGIDKPVPKQQSIQDKIDANRKSPYYQPSGVGSSPYSQVGDFSDVGQKNAYDKMQQLKKNLRL